MDVFGPLTLRPGDRRVRAVVRQLPSADDPWWVERSCARCDRAIDARSGALVVYGPHDSTAPATAALCASCAALLTPFRVALDVARIRALFAGGAVGDALARVMVDLVERVLAMRAGPPTEVIWVRARDTHVLARRLGTTRTDLALRLDDLGVLRAIEVATSTEPGTARRARSSPAPTGRPGVAGRAHHTAGAAGGPRRFEHEQGRTA